MAKFLTYVFEKKYSRTFLNDHTLIAFKDEQSVQLARALAIYSSKFNTPCSAQ